MTVTIIGGSASIDLARKISDRLGSDFVSSSVRTFPDGESKVTLSKAPSDGKIVVVNSTCPPVDTNLVQTLSIISKAREFSDDVVSVVPYMGYSRQDREFLPGEISTLSVVAELLKSSGSSEITSIDIHSDAGIRHFKGSIRNLSAIPDLVAETRKVGLDNPIVVSPDNGGIKRAESFSEIYGTDYTFLNKVRDGITGDVGISSNGHIDLEGRDVIIVDDMISTGGSITKSADFLKKGGCGRIFVACTHAVFIGDAQKRIMGSGVEGIISTNTVPNPTSTVDVSKIIAESISF
ncbi:MAG: ribose-phosphate pyrophosphokinase [Candidatus Aenigmarchaeota archaeon]|nr:ribose-phosphate pyrophosphokinase [Candidatus Aenigmarchaeota archaeon]